MTQSRDPGGARGAPRTPAVPSWLLRRALRREAEREMVLGDLHEQLMVRGRAWYWRASISIAAHALLRRDAFPEPSRCSRGDAFMSMLLTDIRYGLRGLLKRPLLTVTVAVTLALGLGANAAIFNLIDRLVLRPFPAVDPDRVVSIAETGPQLEYRRETVSPPNFVDWRRSADSVTHMSAVLWWDANLVERNDPERLQGTLVSPEFFDALGVRPALGRWFVHDEETFGRHRVVVLSDALWRRRFDADPNILTRRLIIDGEPHQVVGVAPPRFAFPDGSELWAPLAFDPSHPSKRDSRFLTVIARIQPGRTFGDVDAQMSVLAARLAQDYPDANRDHGVRVYTLTQGFMDEGTGPLLALWQASAFVVLLIACANIANLLLARAAERRREIAVRLALGASRWRIVRELVTESTLLALIAVPPAIGFAWLCLYVMRIWMPARIVKFVPGFETLGPDPRLLAFTLGLALLTAWIFGLLPAMQAARARVSDALKEGGRTATGRQWMRRAIVAAEMAIALPLLVAAGLGVIGTARLLNGPQGYDPEHLLTMKIVLPERTYADAAARRRYVQRAVAAVQDVSGVEYAGVTNSLPAGGSNASRSIEIDGHPAADPRNPPVVDSRLVTTDYFNAMGIPIQRGRAFTSIDREGTAPTAIVSESMARKYWPNEDPIGRRLRVPNGPWVTVVGICGDIIQDWFDRRNVPTLYRPIEQQPTDYFALAVRTSGDPDAAAGGVRRALLTVDDTQPVFEMMTMRQRLHERTIGLQYLAGIMTAFAALALLLAAVGLYAIVSYFVEQRRHEIGLRIALGASSGDVMRLTVGQAFMLTALGTAVGLALSVALARVMQAGLLGVATMDARVVAGFAAVLTGTALLASYLPARRASRIDPMTALRAE